MEPARRARGTSPLPYRDGRNNEELKFVPRRRATTRARRVNPRIANLTHLFKH